ncbi:DoxD domain-containing protein [Saccharolobus islandicus]|uniref:TQO small subunit DoxD n=6 Tax=Saccharolobus islandicus TaxID=43080 RepID=M9UC95_SACIS|nr:DoxD domain-containing protein [Sulfolobus islandicus]ACP37578.1 TQO small subunit DoxD [Sulfolobus islandicus M.14.25]ACP54721.1 TQO small subunit DoxD [Sulfolobus islandicus M.16.27]ACR41420.1 TQO small subunit DoxD [Sulfolobus islandicus M.16.4]ADX82046.1 TQO small subunit DoxD [Sulfolobus islandicus HVE10/4]ADX84725.1 TQO small subunit DoxD [Sulfolobus islandicus REY15A]
MAQVAVEETQKFLPILRITLGFMFFSAFVRRAINVPAKLDPNSSAYVGGKLITFLPHAWAPIKGMLENILLNPSLLYEFIILFTALEAIFGLFMILGFLTRLSGLVLAGLAWGIGLAAGWLGSTCVDEWQIAAVEGAAAFMFVFTGSRWFSIDYLLAKKSKGIRVGKYNIPLW